MSIRDLKKVRKILEHQRVVKAFVQCQPWGIFYYRGLKRRPRVKPIRHVETCGHDKPVPDQDHVPQPM